MAALMVALFSALGPPGYTSVTTAAAPAGSTYARSDPAAGSLLPSAPFVLSVWFTDELVSRSTLRVLDRQGMQVDLGDGRVDLDDVDRERMLVSVPALPDGIYTVSWGTVSAEDGTAMLGAFTLGVGIAPESPWAQLGRWHDNQLMTTRWLTMQGPWRIRWHLDSSAEKAAIMIEEQGNDLPVLILGQPGATDGVIERERGGTYRLMFHNSTTYDIVAEDFVGTCER
jgi:methionine-rich copper-binding protein CopC